MRSFWVTTARYRDSRLWRRLVLMTLLLLAGLGAEPALALEGKPKLGPEAVPITQQTEYLRTAPAPDYWMLSSFYLPQQVVQGLMIRLGNRLFHPFHIPGFRLEQAAHVVSNRGLDGPRALAEVTAEAIAGVQEPLTNPGQ